MNRRSFLTLAAFAVLPAPRPRLVAFGDSITAGVGASSPDRAYAALVASALHRRLVNYAVGGSRIAEQVEHIKAAALLPGDTVLWLTGYNDMRAGTPIDEYRASLRGALAHLRGYPLIVGGCLPMTEAGYRAYAPRWSHGSADTVAAYREALHALVPSARPVAGYDPANNADLVHPNDAGHAQIAGAMLMRAYLPHVERGY
jgi:acyl-CoA thioesterase-1